MTRKRPSSRDQTVIYGVHPVEETLRAGRRDVRELYVSREPGEGPLSADLIDCLQIPVSRVAASDLSSISGSSHHQGVAARVGPYPYWDFEDLLEASCSAQGPLLLMDGVQDPSNLGSIIRSAECLGAAGLVIPRDRSVGVTPSVEKVAAGASAHLAVARVVNLVRAMDQLKEAGFWIYGADGAARRVCFDVDLTGRVALVLGSEGQGIRRLVRERCDLTISIPMAGRIGSLNVAQTAAILLAESFRGRISKGISGRIEVQPK